MNEEIGALQARLAAAQDPQTKIDCMNALAWELAYYQPMEALEVTESARHLCYCSPFNRHPYPQGIADSLRNLALIFSRQSDYEKAFLFSSLAAGLYEGLRDLKGQQQVFYILSCIHLDLGNYSDATKSILKALSLSEDTDNQSGIAQSYNLLGLIHLELQDYAISLDYFLRSLDLSQSIGNRREKSNALTNSCEVYYLTQDYNSALNHGQQALLLHRDLNYSWDEPWVLRSLALVDLSLGKTDSAILILEAGIQLAESTQNRLVELECWLVLIQAYQQSHSIEKAKLTAYKALSLAERINAKAHQCKCYEILSQLSKKTEDWEIAFEFLERFHLFKEQILVQKYEAKIQKLRSDNSRKQALLESIYKESADAIFLVDLETKLIMDCNPRAIDLFSAQATDNLMESLSPALSNAISLYQEWVNDHSENTENVNPWTIEVQFTTLDNSTFWGNIALRPVYLTNQSFYLIRITDITEQQSTKASLRVREAQLSTLIDHLPFGVWACDNEQKVVLQNKTDIETYGERIGLRPRETHLNEDILQEWINDIQSAISGKKVEREVIREIDGIPHTLLSITVSIADGSSQLGVLGVSFDLSDYKRVVDQLRDSKSRLQSLLDHAPIGIMIKDLNHRYVMVNKLKRFSILSSAEEALGKTEYDLFPPEKASLLQAHDQQVIDRGEPVQFEETVQVGSRSVTTLSVKFPLRNRQGEIDGLCGMFLDISDRKFIEESLRRSEILFRQTIEKAPIGISLIDVNTLRFVDANPYHCRLLGYTRAELLERCLSDINFPEDVAEDISQVNRLYSGQIDVFQQDKRLIKKDGSTVLTRLFVSLIRDEQGNPIYTLGISEDISTQTQNAQKLAQLAAIVRSSIDAIVSTSLDGTILSWNDGAEALYGYSAEEVLGKNITLLIHSIEDPSDTSTLQSTLERLDPRETVQRHKSGQLIDVFITASTLENEMGELIGVSWIARDISERRALEKLKEQFVSMVSHELRTPLTSIHGSLSALATGKLGILPPKGQRLLEIAEQNSSRLIRLINDILDLERLGSGQFVLQRKPVQIMHLLSQACEALLPIAEKAKITLRLDGDPCLVNIDPDQILQVLTNLLSNAIKFSPPNTIVNFSSYVQESNLLVQVRDQGQGIPSDKLDIIFERFEQVDATDSRQKGGTGLGLAICRSIVQKHGGSIWAESRLGEGSSFFITLPLKQDSV